MLPVSASLHVLKQIKDELHQELEKLLVKPGCMTPQALPPSLAAAGSPRHHTVAQTARTAELFAVSIILYH